MTIKIYKPSKSSMQSGLGKTKQWLAEYISEKGKTHQILKNKLKFFLIQKNKL